jgi:hypothetical protein
VRSVDLQTKLLCITALSNLLDSATVDYMLHEVCRCPMLCETITITHCTVFLICVEMIYEWLLIEDDTVTFDRCYVQRYL